MQPGIQKYKQTTELTNRLSSEPAHIKTPARTAAVLAGHEKVIY